MNPYLEENETPTDISSMKLDYKLPEVKKTTLNKRSLLLKDFIDAINLERKGSKFPLIEKPHQKKRFAMKVAHLNQAELEYFYSMCKDYKRRNGSFSKCFYGALK